jgi:Zn-dependent protease
VTPPRPDPAPRRGRSPRRTSSGWVVGRLAGAPVILTPSWFLAAAVLTVLFAPTVRYAAPDLGAGTYVAAFAFVLLLFGSVFLHEAAHALVARGRGHEVHELALTLWGGHTSYGGDGSPLDNFLVSVVGPVTNLVLAGGFWAGFESVRHSDATLAALLLYAAAFSNAFVGIFNLLPGLPLDGGQMLESAVWAATGSRDKGTVTAGWVGRVLAVGVVVAAIAWPALRGGTVSLTTTVWSVVIAGFLWSGATQAVTTGRARASVSHLTATGLMTPAIVIAADANVTEARTRATPGWALVGVDRAGAPTGVVDPAALAAVPEHDAAGTALAAVSVALSPGALLDARITGSDLVGTVAQAARHTPVLAVMDAGRVLGVLPVQTLIDAVRSAGK